MSIFDSPLTEAKKHRRATGSRSNNDRSDKLSSNEKRKELFRRGDGLFQDSSHSVRSPASKEKRRLSIITGNSLSDESGHNSLKSPSTKDKRRISKRMSNLLDDSCHSVKRPVPKEKKRVSNLSDDSYHSVKSPGSKEKRRVWTRN
eukprot:scaffold16300_cov150-Cylindrotheca_fusiformis.AAC.1